MRGQLGHGEIHVWSVDLFDDGWDGVAKQHHERSSRGEPVERSIESRRARAALERLLGAYLGGVVGPCVVRRAATGRPELAGAEFSFNLSHSRGIALVALSVAPIGVDVEFIDRSSGDPEELVGAVLHPRELDEWRVTLAADRWDRLHRIWVRKEAYAKALGVGLTRDFRAFRVEPVTTGVLRVVDDERSIHSSMYVHELVAPSGFAAAVCTPIVEPWIKRRTLSPRGTLRWT